MSIAVIAGNLAFPPLSGCAMNPRFEHPVFHPMICYFKGLFACATSRATLNVPPDQCDERVLAPAFLVLHCLSQVSEYMCTIATLPLVTASLILGPDERRLAWRPQRKRGGRSAIPCRRHQTACRSTLVAYRRGRPMPAHSVLTQLLRYGTLYRSRVSAGIVIDPEGM
jgi:hypothetical protein